MQWRHINTKTPVQRRNPNITERNRIRSNIRAKVNAVGKTKTTGEEGKGGWPRQGPKEQKKNSFDNKLLAED